MAASLVVMVARESAEWQDGSTVADDAAMLRDRLLTLGEDDVRAFAAVLTASRASDDGARAEALTRAAEVPLEIAERAADVVELATRAADEGKRPLRADAEAAAILAAAATRAATVLVRVNVSAMSHNGDPTVNARLEAGAATAEDRVAAAGR